MKAALDVDAVVAALSREGWAGFSLVRRYLRSEPRGRSTLLGRLRARPFAARPDLADREVRYTFVSNLSTANLENSLVLEALGRGIFARSFHVNRGPVDRAVRDPGGPLYSENPDVVVVAAFPEGDPPEESALAELQAQLIQDLGVVRSRTEALVLVHGVMASERQPKGAREACARLNLALAEQCRIIPGTRFVDLAHLCALAGARFWTQHKTRFISGAGLPESMAPFLAREYAAVGAALRGLARKCLVVDLDNTLWGGVVGEVGTEGLELGHGFPGNLHVRLQQAVGELARDGVLLAINSRNDEGHAWETFENRPEMVLTRGDFSAHRINWRDKVENLRELAEELRLGLDSLVVLDDDATVRGAVEEQVPEVHVLPAGDPLDMLHELAHCRLFVQLERSAEDATRVRSVAEAARRRRELEVAPSREAFLQGLELRVTVGRAGPGHLPRLAQLAQRTNQFNLTTRRYTAWQLSMMSASPDWEILYCASQDRFSDGGLSGLAVLRRHEGTWLVDSLLLSCRVLGWGIERAFLAAIARRAQQDGAEALEGTYRRSARNSQVEGFYRELGFEELEGDEHGARWRSPLPLLVDPTPAWIHLEIP
jgi:FkbH-like protein